MQARTEPASQARDQGHLQTALPVSRTPCMITPRPHLAAVQHSRLRLASSLQHLTTGAQLQRRFCGVPSRSRSTHAVQAVATPDVSSLDASEPARYNLARAANACRRWGWFSFWTQLSLSIVSAGILLFSVAFTSQNGPTVSLYLTLFGIVAGFLSTFWSFGYTRLARRMRSYLTAGPRDNVRRIRKSDVLATLERGAWINILGLVSTLLGLQATVGILVAKTLTNATANPFLSGGAGSYNPVLALDVFLVQASTNTLLSHLTSLLCSLWLIRVVGKNSKTTPARLFAKA
ncbi:hypothetical protein WJX72_007137 [[Myrmecia] bisecta]|uniref:Translocon at inner membrane of chloroplasts 21 n=1 Tax=[Myrmecia] bisecta TaxID=41462 RepID=A0AAW1PD36_9CHLO